MFMDKTVVSMPVMARFCIVPDSFGLTGLPLCLRSGPHARGHAIKT